MGQGDRMSLGYYAELKDILKLWAFVVLGANAIFIILIGLMSLWDCILTRGPK